MPKTKKFYVYVGPVRVNDQVEQVSNGTALVPVVYDVRGMYYSDKDALNKLRIRVQEKRAYLGKSGWVILNPKYLYEHREVQFIYYDEDHDEHLISLSRDKVNELLSVTDKGKMITSIKDPDEFASQAEFYLTNSELFPSLVVALATKFSRKPKGV